MLHVKDLIVRRPVAGVNIGSPRPDILMVSSLLLSVAREFFSNGRDKARLKKPE